MHARRFDIEVSSGVAHGCILLMTGGRADELAGWLAGWLEGRCDKAGRSIDLRRKEGSKEAREKTSHFPLVASFFLSNFVHPSHSSHPIHSPPSSLLRPFISPLPPWSSSFIISPLSFSPPLPLPDLLPSWTCPLLSDTSMPRSSPVSTPSMATSLVRTTRHRAPSPTALGSPRCRQHESCPFANLSSSLLHPKCSPTFKL